MNYNPCFLRHILSRLSGYSEYSSSLWLTCTGLFAFLVVQNLEGKAAKQWGKRVLHISNINPRVEPRTYATTWPRFYHSC